MLLLEANRSRSKPLPLHLQPLTCRRWLALLTTFLYLAAASHTAEHRVAAAAAQEAPATGEEIAQHVELFNRDTIEGAVLPDGDCHLRNMDLCYAGLLGSLARPLPENPGELEHRCDELKVASLCMLDFGRRCSARRDLGDFISQVALGGGAGNSFFKPAQNQQQLLAVVGNGSVELGDESFAMADVMMLCEPSQVYKPGVQAARKKLFKLSKCINDRIPYLKPCIQDMKTAMQIFFEGQKRLPVKPTCCAVGRFRKCAGQVLDNACGFNSFKQLENSMPGSAELVTKTMGKFCRDAQDPESGYCREVLPPEGMASPAQRGRKASKLSRALDLLQAPAGPAASKLE